MHMPAFRFCFHCSPSVATLRVALRVGRNSLPGANRYDIDCTEIGVRISVLKAENLHSGMVSNIFMSNPEPANAMRIDGFQQDLVTA
jgi:hypothetical protein